MENEIAGGPAAPLENRVEPPHAIKKIFMNNRGLRAGWRLLIYMLIVAAISVLIGLAVKHFVHPVRGTPPVSGLYLQEIIGFLVLFGAAAIMAKIERRPVGLYGIPASGAFGKLFWQGWILGLIEVSALVGLIAAFGGYNFGSLAIHGVLLLRWALIWLVFFVFVGFFEEFMFRGYTQFTLAEASLVEIAVLLGVISIFLRRFAGGPLKSFAIWAVAVAVTALLQKVSRPAERFTLWDGVGFWPAAVLLSVGFGAVHLGNPGEGLVGAAAVVMVGLMLALTLKRTGNLWLAIGLHASFDFGETFLYSVPNSGVVFEGHLSNSLIHGPKWLTGGTVGPEGSVFSFITMGLMMVVIHFSYPPQKQLPETIPAAEAAGGTAAS
jgi:membrane protease YdiL (CAAX protease family)